MPAGLLPPSRQACDWVCDQMERPPQGAEGAVPGAGLAGWAGRGQGCPLAGWLAACPALMASHTGTPTPRCAGMPEAVAAYLAAVQVRVEEELAFIDSSR